jgi:hypothetical protein
MKSASRVFLTLSVVLLATAAAAQDASPPVTAQPSVQSEAEKTAPATPAKPARRGPNDRLDLDTTVVTGNRELPKVLYIVPWKKADLGDLPGQPFNTLLDEALTPVDRDVFRREVTYYDAVAAGKDSGHAAVPSESASGKSQ